MNLNDTIAADVNEALKAKDTFRVSALRMLRAAIKNAEIEARHPLSDEEVTTVVAAEVKKLRDALEEFRGGGRQDLVEKNEKEIAVLSAYLPPQLPPEEIRAAAEAKIRELGAGPKDTGKVIGALMKDLKGKADGGTVSRIVQGLLVKG